MKFSQVGDVPDLSGWSMIKKHLKSQLIEIAQKKYSFLFFFEPAKYDF